MTQHLDNCDCEQCRVWFEVARSRNMTGRHSCGQPIDRHALDKEGRIVMCPGGVMA